MRHITPAHKRVRNTVADVVFGAPYQAHIAEVGAELTLVSLPMLVIHFYGYDISAAFYLFLLLF